MNLCNEEKLFYEDTFTKLTQNNPSIKEQSCRPLLNRGIGDSAISDQIWALVSDGSSKQVLKKKDVFRMLKYIAAYQNGYQIENLTLKDLPEMSVPNLSKKKKKNRGGESAKAPIQTEIRNESQVCPQIVEQSPEKDQPQDASPTRGSVMSCPSTEEPVSERHISPDKNHGKELVVEEKPEMLTEQLEKEHQVQEALPNEQESQEPPVEKFESPQNIVENEANVPENVEEAEAVEVVNEEQPVHEEKPQTFEEEEPSVKKLESPQNIVENVVNVPENVEEAETVEVINEEKPVSEEKPQAFEEEAVVVNVHQDEFPAIHIHNEVGLELTKQLNLIKNAQTGTLEDVQHNDDDERRSKGSETSSRASIKSHRSHMSVDSAHRQAMNLLKYNQYLEQNQKFQVEIRDTITYNSGFLGYGTYTSYLIRSKYPDSGILETERRFSDFDWLNSYLRSHLPYKGLVFPTLPEKKSIGNNEPGFIQQRKAELDRYLKEISRHKVLSQDPILRTFLGEKAKEGFQSLKDKIPVNGLALPELDWLKIKEVCEYAMASVKVKLQKDSIPNDWKDSNEKIYDVLRIDGAIKKLLKTLQKREELYKTVKTMNNNLNVVHMKIMNRVEKEAYYAIGSLSSLMFAQARNMNDEAVITENLKKQIKVFRAKIDGCKKSYALLISTLQEIGTNKELHKNKQGKLFEYKAEKNMNGIAALTKELGEIEKKVETLEKETGIIKDNLDLEADYLVELFDVFLPDALSFFNSQQAEHIERVTKTWEGISQE